MTARLEAKGIAIRARLEPTDFRVDHGGLICLIGPNGSGKTSLLHALAGIGDPSGIVRIDGHGLDRLAPEERKRLLSFLPASREIAWPLSARDVISLGLPAADPPDALAETIAALDLVPFLDRRIDRLSTGERSRVLIARALAGAPHLVLLDEPAANLDPQWQLRLMGWLKGLAGAGATVIAAMHDLDLAARFADRLVLMEKGRVAADGNPADLMSGAEIPRVFGVTRGHAGWELISPTADPRSSR